MKYPTAFAVHTTNQTIVMKQDTQIYVQSTFKRAIVTVSQITDRVTKGGNDASLLLSVFTSIGDSRSLV